MMRQSAMIKVRGTQLYVEIQGDEKLPVLLYLHGGPGVSCYDFTVYQMERLSANFRVITFDQRGVLRSDPIQDNEPFGIDDLIEDSEALRVQLGIKSWSVLGHSFGGHLGVRYAVSYPDAVDCLVMECPSFDLDLSLRSHLRALALEFADLDEKTKAIEALTYANGTQCGQDTLKVFSLLQNHLGSEKWEAMHIHGPNKVFPGLWSEAPASSEQWSRTGRHSTGLFQEGKIFDSIVPLLKSITKPTLLIKGKYDLVTCDKQLLAYLTELPNGEISIFRESGHFPRIEQPELYAQVVTNFIWKTTSNPINTTKGE